jgi:hypothetical protein
MDLGGVAVAVTSMSQMWALLRTHTLSTSGERRDVNHLNEWGGFSDRLEMPVFTAWRDHTAYDKLSKTVTATVLNSEWSSAVGVNNQERWLKYAEEHGGQAAFFIIHAMDEGAQPRKVQYIDDDAVFVGLVVRVGTDTHIVGKRRAL